MRIVTIAAGQQPFIDFVMKWLRERRFHVCVAGVAQLRLRDFEEIGFALKGMRAVTVGAAYLGAGMRGALEVRMRSGVAAQTARIHFFSGSLPEEKYLGFVTTARHVIGARPVAAFATLVGGAAFLIKRRLPVRRLRPTVVEVFVASLARVRPYISGIFRRRCSLCRVAGRATGLKVLFSRLLSLAQRRSRAEER
jgi:hypothetical protein